MRTVFKATVFAAIFCAAGLAQAQEDLSALQQKGATALADLVASDDPLRIHDLRFDARHAAEAIDYLKSGSAKDLTDMAALPALDHLLRHARRFDYDLPRDSALALAQSLVQVDPDQKRDLVEQAARSLEAFSGAMQRDPSWVGDVLRYLPRDFRFHGALFLTFGYDIGVSEGATASLNACHWGFKDHPRELVYYAIHELHHTGFMAYNSFPPISRWKTFKDLRDWALYATELEGMAVWAAYPRREAEGALAQDGMGDYLALDDAARMARLVTAYNKALDSLERRGAALASTQDRDEMFRSFAQDRLWYRVGAHMARRIEAEKGRDYLVSLIKEGPAAFRQAYLALGEARSRDGR